MADTCPDCLRHISTRPGDSGCRKLQRKPHEPPSKCDQLTITRLRARVAELEQAHAEQVAERELRSSAWEKIESWRESDPGSHDAEIVVATDSGGMRFTGKDAPVSALAWCEAERARQAKGAKREGCG